jgi:hypothetical protein
VSARVRTQFSPKPLADDRLSRRRRKSLIAELQEG